MEETNPLVTHLHNYAVYERNGLFPEPVNLLYKLFSKDRSERMWREQFPCPHEPGCPFGGNCCFARKPRRDFSFGAPTETDGLREEFEGIKRALHSRRLGPPKEREEESELHQEVYEHIWHDICPCIPGPHCPYRDPTQMEKEEEQDKQALADCDMPLEKYVLHHGLVFYTSLCRFFYKSPYNHRQLCKSVSYEVAHTLKDLLTPFHDAKIMLFYLQRMIKMGRIGALTKKIEVPFKVIAEEQVSCHHCTNRLSVRVEVHIGTPSLMVNCCHCHKNTLLDIYQ